MPSISQRLAPMLTCGLLLAASAAHAATTAVGCSAGTACTAPSRSQAETLFGKIELFYPSFFAPDSASRTQTQAIDGATAYYRNYGGSAALGLATYRGGLWFAIDGNWQHYASLDDANRLFCNGACWNSGSATAAFNMAQTLSDQAQRTTLAFSGLALMTGNLEAQSFFPPGKVADYTGFQYLRDNDPDNMGHNTSFLTRVANNVIYILNDAQFAKLKELAIAQLDMIDQYGYQRFALMKAFRRLIDDDLPAGATGLNLYAVKQASRALYRLDGQISFDRAALYADIIKSLDAGQRAYLAAMQGRGWNSWPDIDNAQVRDRMQGLPQGSSVAVMTYASDLFSWYAGSLEADVYFCPERHGTYFGSFYMKDAPAVGHEGYGIDEQITATAGAALSDSAKGYVTAEQAALMASLVDAQHANLMAIVTIRTEIASQLRSLLISTAASAAVEAQVLALSASYGELDGANNYAYASVFAQLYASLSAAQKARLADLRTAILSGAYADGTAFDYSVATRPYLYAEAIQDSSVLAPYIDNTDYLFFEP